MNNRKAGLSVSIVGVSAALVLSLFVTGSAFAWWPFGDDNSDVEGQLTELVWEDLIPDDFVQPVNPLIDMTQEEVDKLLDGSTESNARLEKLEAEFNYAPINPTIDGKRVKIPAYITPLEFDGQSEAKEFLLVPYVGACMHTPPPPANQVVHAMSPEIISIPSMYEPVWAVGVIKAETVKSDLAESGYKLEVEKLFPYKKEQ